jgi:hypothetical protein
MLLVCFKLIRNILRQFCMFYDHLVSYLVLIRYILVYCVKKNLATVNHGSGLVGREFKSGIFFSFICMPLPRPQTVKSITQSPTSKTTCNTTLEQTEASSTLTTTTTISSVLDGENAFVGFVIFYFSHNELL